MNLISTIDRASYESAFDDLHDTFGEDIVLIKEVKTPKVSLTDDDDYNFVSGATRVEEFDYTSVSTTIKARIQYIERQEKNSAFFSVVQGNDIPLVSKLGLIRIKVKNADAAAVSEANNIIVNGNNCHLITTDSPHGIVFDQYSTFYLQRTP